MRRLSKASTRGPDQVEGLAENWDFWPWPPPRPGPTITAVDHLRTLLVDDDTDGARQLARVVECHLGSTIIVPDVYQALDRLREERFDAVVLEIALPGASGIDLLERLVSGTPAVVLTWLVSPAISARALGAGAHTVLSKPCPAAELVAAVRAAVRPRTGGALVTL
jgi:DNA-binding response OmpR family regulator